MVDPHTERQRKVNGISCGIEPKLTRRSLLRSGGAGLAGTGLLFTGDRAMGYSNETDEVDGGIEPPTSESLEETGQRQRRWLSLPRSRLVLNPADTFDPHHKPDSGLSLNAAYYYGDEFHHHRDLVTTRWHAEERDGELDVGTALSFDTGELIETESSEEYNTIATEERDDGTYTVNPLANATLENEQLEVAIPDANFGWVSTWVTVDLNETPHFLVDIAESAGTFELKVAADDTLDTHPPDISVFRSGEAGTHVFNLQEAVNEQLVAQGLEPWEGTKEIQLRLFATFGESITFNSVQFLNYRSPLIDVGATGVDSSWTPHRVRSEATGDEGTVRSDDLFYDRDTLARQYTVSEEPTENAVLSGRIAGDATLRADRNALLIERDGYSYAVAFSRESADGFRFYPSQLALLTLSDGYETPSNEARYWSIELDGDDLDDLTVGVGFATANEGKQRALERAAGPTETVNWKTVLDRRRAEWTDYLQKEVPHPIHFDLEGIDDRGVSAADVRRNYYVAWVFLRSNILPETPETDYPYPEFSVGKPSMWTHGPPGARTSATWESLLEMQLYAFVDPETSWEAFSGIMSRVTDSGQIEGESLPSHKAQTAWILYQLTEDDTSLEAIYDPLKRYLLWRRDNPRWIHLDHDYPNQRDADFVIKALLDMSYAEQIASVLDRPSEVELWKNERTALFEDYLNWFWEEPTGEPASNVFLNDDGTVDEREFSRPSVIGMGMHLDCWEDEPQLETIEAAVSESYDVDRTLLGIQPPWNKYGNYGYTVRGLIDRELTDLAHTMINVGARDVARANVFAEQYIIGNDHPEPDGVTPSAFGMVKLIDMVLLKNGYRYDRGWPQFVRLPNEAGGVKNVSIRGKTLDIFVGGDAVRLKGSFVNQRPSCRALSIPVGGTARLPSECATGNRKRK